MTWKAWSDGNAPQDSSTSSRKALPLGHMYRMSWHVWMPLDSKNWATFVGLSSSKDLKAPSIPASGRRGRWRSRSHRREELLPEGLDAASHLGSEVAELDAGWWLRWICGDLDRVSLVALALSVCLECLVAISPAHTGLLAQVTDQVLLITIPAHGTKRRSTSFSCPGVATFAPTEGESATGTAPYRSRLARSSLHLLQLLDPKSRPSSKRSSALNNTQV